MRIIKSLQGAALAVANIWTALQTFNTAAPNKIIDLQSGGTEEAYFDQYGNLVLISAGNPGPNASPWIGGADTQGSVRMNVATGKFFYKTINGAAKYTQGATGYTVFGGLTTAGAVGVPVVVASSIQSQSNAAPTTVSYTPPATAGTYRITANLEITTATTITFKNKLTYTSASGAATTDRPVWERQGSATILAEPTANTADRFVMEPYQFTIDNSAGAIALADDAGTYTTCAYRLGVILEQLA